MTKLGEKLKNTISLLEKNNITTLEDQAGAKSADILAYRNNIFDRLHELKKEIFSIIDNHNVPLIKVQDEEFEKWLRFVYSGSATNIDLWDQFKKILLDELLEVVLLNDVNGMRVTVKPKDPPVLRAPKRG